MIAIYVHALAATGVVRNARILAADLAGRGYAVSLVTALPGGDAVAGVPHHALLPRPSASRLLEKAKAAMALHRHLRRTSPALLISAGNHGHLTAWAGSRRVPGLKRVYRISNDVLRAVPGAPAGGLKRWGRLAAARLLTADADHLVLVSPTLGRTPSFADAARRGRVTVIPNAIDAAAARRSAEGRAPHRWMHGDRPVIIAIGRLAPQKNFGTLLHAFALLRSERPARLILLGESRDRARQTLEAQARALGIADDLDLPGTVANVFPWLAHADAFILSSWWEGSANVLLEAMAVNTPCVASRSAGNAQDILADGRHGLLVDPADPASMARALERQIDPANALYPAGRIAAFSLADMSAAWARVIETL